jgi:hypothetical protein
MHSLPVMKENQLGHPMNFLSCVILGMLGLGALFNIYYGNVTYPKAFWVALVGFILFAVGKLSVILKKKKLSFGTKLMTENMANLYRIGYWLMIVGLLATFAP